MSVGGLGAGPTGLPERWSQWDSRRRVGLATGKKSSTFTLDWVSHRIELEADFIAGETLRLGDIEVWEGDHLDVVILNQG